MALSALGGNRTCCQKSDAKVGLDLWCCAIPVADERVDGIPAAADLALSRFVRFVWGLSRTKAMMRCFGPNRTRLHVGVGQVAPTQSFHLISFFLGG